MDRRQKKQEEVRRNYQRTKCGVLWGSYVRQDSELVKFCEEMKSDEDLKEALGIDSTQVTGDLHKSHSNEGVQGCM